MIQNPNELESPILLAMNEEDRPVELSIASSANGENTDAAVEGRVVAYFSVVNPFTTVFYDLQYD